MSQIHPDKRTKGQILRLLDHAMQQEEKFAEKIQTLENQLAECRKRAEDPRYEITESALPASKVSFRLDYYRTEKKGPVRGIIEHLSSRESRSFGPDDGFDTIQQFVGKYLPVKARPKPKPIAPPSPFLENQQPEATAQPDAQPAAVVLGNEPTTEAAPAQPEAAAQSNAQPAAVAVENEPPTEAAPTQPEAAAEPEAIPPQPPAQTAAFQVSEDNPRRSRLSDLPATSLVSNGRLAARIRRSLSLPDATEPEERPEAAAAQPSAAVVQAPAPEAVASGPHRSRLSDSPTAPLVANERLAARIRRSFALPGTVEPEEIRETTAPPPVAVKAPAEKVGGKAAVFSVLTEGSGQHQAALQHDQHFQVEIPTAQLPEFQGKPCHARLVAENLETGEQIRAVDSCEPSPAALRFPKRPLQLPAGGYRLTAVLGLSADPRTVFYRESRLVVVRPHPQPLSGREG